LVWIPSKAQQYVLNEVVNQEEEEELHDRSYHMEVVILKVLANVDEHQSLHHQVDRVHYLEVLETRVINDKDREQDSKQQHVVVLLGHVVLLDALFFHSIVEAKKANDTEQVSIHLLWVFRCHGFQLLVSLFLH